MAFQCRICLDEEETDINFIVPCKCRGSVKYIHRKCLDLWRSQNPQSDNFKRCNTCLFEYVIEQVPQNPEKERKRLEEYNRLVEWDVFIVVMIIILIISVTALLFYIMDTGFIRKSMYPWFSIDNNFIFYILVALSVIFLSIAVITMVIFGYGASYNQNYTSLWIIMGAFISAYSVYTYIKYKMDLHRQKIWLRQEVLIQRVKDFKDHMNDLDHL